MKLTYVRKLSESIRNRAAMFALPRAIAQSWAADNYDQVALIFDTEQNCIIVTPMKSDTASTA